MFCKWLGLPHQVLIVGEEREVSVLGKEVGRGPSSSSLPSCLCLQLRLILMGHFVGE